MLSGYSIGEITAIIIFFVGIYGIIARRNIVKTVISFGVMETGVILFFIAGGLGTEKAPILADTGDIARGADPYPAGIDDHRHRHRHRGDCRGLNHVYQPLS